MKKVLLLLLCFAFSTSVFARDISVSEAEKVAKNFYYEHVQGIKSLDYNDIWATVSHTHKEKGVKSIYFVNMLPEGWVAVSASDQVIPVLAYSFTGFFSLNENAVNFNGWMKAAGKEIKKAKEHSLKGSQKVVASWDHLLNASPSILKGRNIRLVEPMLYSSWNQGTWYNEMCPEDPAGPGDRVYAGCVPTAMGQLMNYWRHPQFGTGSYTYTEPDYGVLTADFANTEYKWADMPLYIDRSNKAIAELLFHLGVSVDLDYGPNGSGMYNHKAAYSLRTHFGYDSTTTYIFRDTTSLDWDSIAVAHLDNQIPLYYAGWADTINQSGHAFVCDGYQDTAYFHFNWGWGGSYDGYFYINNLTPGGSDFTLDHELIINMVPQTVTATGCNGTDTLSQVAGTIEDGSGPVRNYASNADCYWLISPQDSIQGITLEFLKIKTEAGHDSIVVYDGPTVNDPILGVYAGCYGSPNLPTLTSSGNQLLIHFSSNGNTTDEGFIAEYRGTTTKYCKTMTTLTAASGTIDDGSGQWDYNGNSLCRWRVQPTGADNIIISFNHFELEAGDELEIIDNVNGTSMGTFTGNTLPDDIWIHSGKAMIIFQSNTYDNADGFSLDYRTSATGLIEKEDDQFSIFPNPVSDRFIVVWESTSESGNLDLLDIRGKILLSQPITRGKTEINLNGISTGIYIIRIENNGINLFKKLIVK